MNGMKCSNCRFVSKTMKGKKVISYKCVRYAPKPVHIETTIGWDWPTVLEDDRCGDWRGVKVFA